MACWNMLNRIKSYYSSLYLVTSDYYYLEIFENLETVQIATIHRYVKSFLEEMGPYFGYGSSIQIKSFKYLKNSPVVTAATIRPIINICFDFI